MPATYAALIPPTPNLLPLETYIPSNGLVETLIRKYLSLIDMEEFKLREQLHQEPPAH